MAIRTIDGATISFASRRSGIPPERRWVAAPAGIEAASMVDQKVWSALLMAASAALIADCGLSRPASALFTFV
jgi:hypothetical protein